MISEKLSQKGILIFDAHDSACIKRIQRLKFNYEIQIFTSS